LNGSKDKLRLSGTDKAGEKKRRLVFTRNSGLKEQLLWLDWAPQRGIATVVLPLSSRLSSLRRLEEEAHKRDFIIERGGWDLSLIARRGIFMPGEMLRMENGRRRNDYNFCPTNPRLITRIRENAARLFALYEKTESFHLWPDRGHEEHWCSCPACRAFSWEEQNLMAVRAAAEVLAALRPAARIFYYAPAEFPQAERPGIGILPNMHSIQKLPGRTDAGEAGWFLAQGVPG
jgi:hypothetical protein